MRPVGDGLTAPARAEPQAAVDRPVPWRPRSPAPSDRGASGDRVAVLGSARGGADGDSAHELMALVEVVVTCLFTLEMLLRIALGC